MEKLFVAILIEKEDSESPQIKFVKASDEGEAYDKFAKLIGFEPEELLEGEESGDIYITIEECIESTNEN